MIAKQNTTENNVIDAGRAETPLYEPDVEVKDEFAYAAQQGGLAALQSSFSKPALIWILAVVALATAVAAWVTAVVTRPLAKLTAVAAAVSRGVTSAA